MGSIVSFATVEKKECNCGGQCSCGHDHHNHNEVVSSFPLDMMQCTNKPFFAVTPVNAAFSKIGNIYISENMMNHIKVNPEMDMDAIRSKIFKINQALWSWEEKNNFVHQNYLLSGFDNINHCRIESVDVGHSGMRQNGIIVAMVTNDNLEISGIKAAGV